MPTIDPKQFRNALGHFLSGVTVMVTEDEDELHGMTASAFVSVSLDPPLVLVSVAKKASIHDRVARAGRFSISVLAASQEGLSNHFAGYGKGEPVLTWIRDGWDTPVIDGAIAQLSCNLWATHPGGDHTLYVGEVTHINVPGGAPLAYFCGGYVAVGGAD
jgi:flavin reductase (DIM6/NTAB) family NADH-FMN oxidoreductase RutF